MDSRGGGLPTLLLPHFTQLAAGIDRIVGARRKDEGGAQNRRNKVTPHRGSVECFSEGPPAI